jgi:hypothetical protein
MSGGLRWKKPTPNDPTPKECAKDGRYEHSHDALGYGLVNMVPLTEDHLDDGQEWIWRDRELVPMPPELMDHGPAGGFEVYENVHARW